MCNPTLPVDETRRLQTLRAYEILDTDAEPDFDDLTQLASLICDAPIALISLIDATRQWFKSTVGMAPGEGPRRTSFCAHAILGRELFVVSDAASDDRFADNPQVTGDPHVRFYAGAPLVGPEGHAFGTLCVIDRVPRQLRPEQADALRSIGRQVVSQMRLRKTARSLAIAERSTRATLDALAACIVTVGQTGEVLSVNRAWQQANGGQGFFPGCGVGDDYASHSDARLLPDPEAHRSFASDLRRLARGEVSELSCECRGTAADQDRWFRLAATRVGGPTAGGVVVVHEEVTEQRRLAGLERERHGLKDAVRSMEKVLGVVGHELRTPLAGLRAMAEFMSEPKAQGTPEWSGFLASFGEEVVRMSDTVDALLEAARLNSGRARWNWSRFDVEPICREVVESIRLLMTSDQVALAWDAAPALGMDGDAGGIHRLLLNLVGNARKHTVAGEIRIRARQARRDGQAWVVLSVTDTGGGIPPELAGRLGEAFALNSGVVGETHVSGTGLGLAICQGIVAAHGGRLAIESSPGRGTTVTAEMRADLTAPVIAPQDGAAAGASPPLLARPSAA